MLNFNHGLLSILRGISCSGIVHGNRGMKLIKYWYTFSIKAWKFVVTFCAQGGFDGIPNGLMCLQCSFSHRLCRLFHDSSSNEMYKSDCYVCATVEEWIKKEQQEECEEDTRS